MKSHFPLGIPLISPLTIRLQRSTLVPFVGKRDPIQISSSSESIGRWPRYITRISHQSASQSASVRMRLGMGDTMFGFISFFSVRHFNSSYDQQYVVRAVSTLFLILDLISALDFHEHECYHNEEDCKEGFMLMALDQSTTSFTQ